MDEEDEVDEEEEEVDFEDVVEDEEEEDEDVEVAFALVVVLAPVVFECVVTCPEVTASVLGANGVPVVKGVVPPNPSAAPD